MDGRDDEARVASIMAVRPLLIGVACVSTTDPTPSPATMLMTMVRGSGQWKRASTSIPTRPKMR